MNVSGDDGEARLDTTAARANSPVQVDVRMPRICYEALTVLFLVHSGEALRS